MEVESGHQGGGGVWGVRGGGLASRQAEFETRHENTIWRDKR